MSYISSHFTGATATSPLGLPLDTASALRSNVKFCARTALPGLDKVYQEAKATAKERLSHNLYPEFVKHQLSQCLTASLVSSCTLTGEARTPYPGLGDAFCLTDPFRPDNPMVFASDGLVAMSGFRRRELVGKNCRLFQGSATDPEAACRLSQALLAGREATELILNYRPDGTPYWNFLFICPLMENGGVRYYLGAQINVSEHMGAECDDILGVLNFGPDPEESHPSRIPSPPDLGGWSARQSSESLAPGHPDEHQHAEKHHSRRHRFLRHFHRRTPSSLASSPSRPSTASEATTGDAPPPSYPYPPPRSHPPPLSPLLGSPHFEHFHPQLNQHLDEHSTPYARFLVMRYTPTPTSTPAHSYTTTPPPQPPPPPSNAPSRPRPQTRRLTRARDHPPPLTVAFASTFALTLLGLRPHEAHELVGRDVFSVLAAQLASPSVNRAFRANMMSKMARGEAVGVELMATATAASAAASGQGAGQGAGLGEGGEGLGVRMGRPHVRGAKSAGAAVGSGSGSGSSLGLGSESEEGGGGGGRPRLGGAVEKGSGFFSQVLFTGAKGPLRGVIVSFTPSYQCVEELYAIGPPVV
ncbi:hypothetical protein NEMBOFW57_007105 [Staphylotrichum longicolle]|uniref:PAS domain-containing protein n=1 Tax=Staphylotrichum longicolle TaxID=669026 RepID=A0AAD4EU28_9PEZI|nr:hypothetical protein NEMBOFW57_007105 [Staphylotrichum longicolle]